MLQDSLFNNPRVHPLKGLLKDHRISQAQVAFALGISRPYANQILNGLAPVPAQLKGKLDQLTQELRGDYNEQ